MALLLACLILQHKGYSYTRVARRKYMYTTSQNQDLPTDELTIFSTCIPVFTILFGSFLNATFSMQTVILYMYITKPLHVQVLYLKLWLRYPVLWLCSLFFFCYTYNTFFKQQTYMPKQTKYQEQANMAIIIHVPVFSGRCQRDVCHIIWKMTSSFCPTHYSMWIEWQFSTRNQIFYFGWYFVRLTYTQHYNAQHYSN